jgi:hypothetical protein
MKFRKLRIAFSAACGVLCLLLIALWLRSYRWNDQFSIHLSDSRVIGPNSFSGRLSFGICTSPDAKFMWPAGLNSEPIINQPPVPNFSFGRMTGTPPRTVDFVWVPYWFLLLLATAVGVSPWIRWSQRFSLRTLLIATTVVAVVLGTVVYAARR